MNVLLGCVCYKCVLGVCMYISFPYFILLFLLVCGSVGLFFVFTWPVLKYKINKRRYKLRAYTYNAITLSGE
jgi:hypothetical protein